ncbi:MAG: glycosyl transferase [Campylobacterota bacterium]|nr:glycosyl transferase [Campylobacterota bacterium]
MSQYSRFERKIAFILTKFPSLKSNIKKFYQKLNYIRYRKSYSMKSDYKITKIGSEFQESYFGYYDKSPMNLTNEYIIFQNTNVSTKGMPNSMVHVDLVLYDVLEKSYEAIGKSYTYNWQQGTKLMWIDKYKFIYNDFNNIQKHYISKIYDLESNKSRVIDYAIYDCYEDKFAISLDFERLGVVRKDYSYNNLGLEINWNDNSDDGLYYIDLQNNSSELIITIDEIINFNPKETMIGAKHKFNHVMISPDGTKMMFMHRWFLTDGRRYDTLYVSNINGGEIKKISDDDMVSHCFWYDNNNIFAYLRDKDIGDKYYMLNINTLDKKTVGQGVIDSFGDGHPHVHGKKIVFDTYPDKSRMKSLFLYDYETNELLKLGEVLESFDFYGETRCDLHPRFSYDGKKVFFDSVHEGTRGLYMLDLDR